MSSSADQYPTLDLVPTTRPFTEGPRPIRVLSFDPGFARMGVAVVDVFDKPGPTRFELAHRETFVTSVKQATEDRLDAICHRVVSLFTTYHPDIVAWENVAAVAAGKGKNSAGASSAGARIKEVCGMYRAAAFMHGDRDCFILMPASYRKMVFGKGQSKGKSKGDLRAIVERFLKVKGLSFDESEASAMAIYAYSLLRPRGKR